jgi:hypothetical protein
VHNAEKPRDRLPRPCGGDGGGALSDHHGGLSEDGGDDLLRVRDDETLRGPPFGLRSCRSSVIGLALPRVEEEVGR